MVRKMKEDKSKVKHISEKIKEMDYLTHIILFIFAGLLSGSIMMFLVLWQSESLIGSIIGSIGTFMIYISLVYLALRE